MLKLARRSRIRPARVSTTIDEHTSGNAAAATERVWGIRIERDIKETVKLGIQHGRNILDTDLVSSLDEMA